MSNIFPDSVDVHTLHNLGDVLFHIAAFMDPIEASVISKRFLHDVEQRAADALQSIIKRMTNIMADDYMSRLTEAALAHCKILPCHRPFLPLPQRLLLLVSHRIIVVTGAGTPEVNGVYTKDQYFEGACMYTRQGWWNNATRRFHLFQCTVSDNTKYWYISIVPDGEDPGTSSDLDFYCAPGTVDCLRIPPVYSWVKEAFFGVDPPPTLSYMCPCNEQDHRQRLEDMAVLCHAEQLTRLDESMSSSDDDSTESSS